MESAEYIDPKRDDIIVIPMNWSDVYHYAIFDAPYKKGAMDHESSIHSFCQSVNMTRREGLHSLLFLCVLFNDDKHRMLLVWLLYHFGSELDFSKHIVHAAASTDDGKMLLPKSLLTSRPLFIAKVNENEHAAEKIMEFLTSRSL